MLVAVLLLAWPAMSFAADAAIRFRPTATVERAIIVLGDVADIVGSDEQQAARLKAVQLVPAPLPGESLRLEFGIVRSRLQAHGFNLGQLEFAGHSVVTVRRSEQASGSAGASRGTAAEPATWKQERAERRIAEAIREHCTRHVPELGVVQVAVELRPQDADRVIAAVGQTISIDAAAIPTGEAQPLRVRIGGREAGQSIDLSARVTPWPWVLAANVDLPAGHRLRVADLAWSQMESTDGLFTEVERLIDLEMARPLRAGQPVRADDVRTVPLVRSGDIVTVTSRSGAISIRRPMKARSEGALGEEVTLTTLDGRERLTARVTGFHEAQVGVSGQPVAATGPESGVKVMIETESSAAHVPSTTVEAWRGTP